MRKNIVIGGLMLLAGLAASGSAMADRHGHFGVGVYIGPPYIGSPYFGYPYYPYPYPYYPPVVAVPTPVQPPVYVEQAPAQISPAPAQPANNYWYHCDNPEGYYPYIKECPGGWQKVLPTPPAQ
jgi:hypothetical protein